MRNIMIAAALLLAAGTLVAADAPCPPTWTYCDLNQWPSYCQSGNAQSPIDFPRLQSVAGQKLQFSYKKFKPSIKNTSRSIKVTNPTGKLLVDGVPYELIELHFHVPGEHTFGGKAMPLELHLVHGTGGTAKFVVAVLFKDGESADEELGEIIKAFPINACDHKDRNDELNPQKLLPDDRNLYYTYGGSLTTPDCGQELTWFVLTAPREATKAQRDALLREVGGANARQSRNAGGRRIALVDQRKKK